MATSLFVGGARSGKSRLAQAAMEALPGPWTYVATAQGRDAEMAGRIARHRADRGAGWRTVECPIDLAQTIRTMEAPVLVDCLTLWLTNIMLGGHDVTRCNAELVAAIRAARHPLMLVSNEVGLGIVPEHPLGRAFRDAAGRLNQSVAAAVDRTWFVVAGMVLPLQRFEPTAPAPTVRAE
ncbi:bifunctional adenosylcobinamide kinase/adenosylcobinamide-phosphate guanylyltransferase [Sphingomonas hankookensis]|uniref:Bifunctional adenosylcobalamin biosynthesis protein n=1 Tax=Sphingomonas hengshuiensis TaxID=1609977 RepID=A0A2W4YW16_9SPHN|nr:MAG: bifunctional adenosylcobinamide kinase/adenosylcobinamide-phosphate guanylyltransferase [Sphingomonas hengshuiensis]